MTHDNITGTTEVILENPNSTRAHVSVLYNPNEPTLSSKTSKLVITSRALTNLENEISVDYVFFNSTDKFPHKYSISDQIFIINRQVMWLIMKKAKESQAKY